tara:strand:- start:81 stop:794 length:714 start_codon:yes stop_codon:yes gene_type:complete
MDFHARRNGHRKLGFRVVHASRQGSYLPTLDRRREGAVVLAGVKKSLVASFVALLMLGCGKDGEKKQVQEEARSESNTLSEKLTPKAARQFLAEEIGRWKAKVTERTKDNPPKTYDDVIVARWEEKGKVIRYESNPLINGERVPIKGFLKYDAKEGVFIWRAQREGFPDVVERQTYDRNKNTLNAESTFPNGAKRKITWLKAGKDEWRGMQVISFEGMVVYTQETILKRMLEDPPNP